MTATYSRKIPIKSADDTGQKKGQNLSGKKATLKTEMLEIGGNVQPIAISCKEQNRKKLYQLITQQ